MIPIDKQTKFSPNIIYLCAAYHKSWVRVLDIMKSTCRILNKNKYTRILFKENHILISIILCMIEVCLIYFLTIINQVIYLQEYNCFKRLSFYENNAAAVTSNKGGENDVYASNVRIQGSALWNQSINQSICLNQTESRMALYIYIYTK